MDVSSFFFFCFLFLRVRTRTIAVLVVFLISCPDTNTGWTLCKLLMLTSFIRFRFRGYTTVPVRNVLTSANRSSHKCRFVKTFTTPLSLLISLCRSARYSFKETKRPLHTCPFPSACLHRTLSWLRVLANGFPPRGSTLLQRHLHLLFLGLLTFGCFR